MSMASYTATASPRSSSGAPKGRSPTGRVGGQGRGRHSDRARGQTYIFSAAKFGEPFTIARCGRRARRRGARSACVCSHNPEATSGHLQDVRLDPPAKDGFVPYRDYIGSVLEILDVQTAAAGRLTGPTALRGAQLDDGRRRAHLQHERHGERRGRLFRFDLATRQPTQIDTGTTTATTTTMCCRSTARCSASATAAEDRHRRSTPCRSGGGTPKRITQLGPSYLHGGRRTRSADLHRREETASSTSTASRRRRRGRGQPDQSRALTTDPSIRPTASTSISTPCAAGRCKSGGCSRTATTRNK